MDMLPALIAAVFCDAVVFPTGNNDGPVNDADRLQAAIDGAAPGSTLCLRSINDGLVFNANYGAGQPTPFRLGKTECVRDPRVPLVACTTSAGCPRTYGCVASRCVVAGCTPALPDPNRYLRLYAPAAPGGEFYLSADTVHDASDPRHNLALVKVNPGATGRK